MNETLTLVIDALPAMSSRVPAQTVVLVTSGVAGPLQDWDVRQKPPTKFSFPDVTSDAIAAGL